MEGHPKLIRAEEWEPEFTIRRGTFSLPSALERVKGLQDNEKRKSRLDL